MSNWQKYRLGGNWKADLISISLLALLLLALFLQFPLHAIFFQPSLDHKRHADAAGCDFAFVILTDEEESAALTAARASWQVSSENVRRLRAELLSPDLPAMPADPVLPISARESRFEVPEPTFALSVIPVSHAAAPMPKINAPTDKEPNYAFSRDEMIAIPDFGPPSRTVRAAASATASPATAETENSNSESTKKGENP